MKRYIRVLKKLGLKEKEVQIYLDLVEHGASSITDILERTGLHRPEAYRLIPLLMEEGFITELKKSKRRLFEAESPEKLIGLLENLENDLSNIIPDLISMHSNASKRPSVKYQEGKKSITYVFSDIVSTLGKGDIFYRVSSEKDVEISNRYLPKDYREKRDKKQLERYVIMSENTSIAKKPRLEREIVTIPPELDEFTDNVQMIIYGNKVAFIDFNSESSIIIENAFIAGFQLKLFKMLFGSLNKKMG